MYISTFVILVIEVLELFDVLSRSRADRHSPRHFLARGRVIERVAFAHPSLRTSSSRCATWTSCACCGTTATARPARDRPRKRQTSPPRRWTPQRAPGKTRALQRRRETRTLRCAMSRVSTGVARAFEFAPHDPVNDPCVTAPPRPPRPSLATVRLPPIKREIFFSDSHATFCSPPRRPVASRTPTPRTAERSCFSTRPLRETTPTRRSWKRACFPIAR